MPERYCPDPSFVIASPPDRAELTLDTGALSVEQSVTKVLELFEEQL